MHLYTLQIVYSMRIWPLILSNLILSNSTCVHWTWRKLRQWWSCLWIWFLSLLWLLQTVCCTLYNNLCMWCIWYTVLLFGWVNLTVCWAPVLQNSLFLFCVLFLSTVQLRDHMGHLYAAKDLRLHFTEPVREPPSPEKVEKLLADNVHWSERGMFREGKSGPVVKIRGFEAPGS